MCETDLNLRSIASLAQVQKPRKWESQAVGLQHMAAATAIGEHRQGPHSLSANGTTFHETLAQVGGTTSGWRRQKGPETAVSFVWSPQYLMYWWHWCQTMSPLGNNQIFTRWVLRNSITRLGVYSGSLKFWKFIALWRSSFILPLEDVKDLRKRIFPRL